MPRASAVALLLLLSSPFAPAAERSERDKKVDAAVEKALRFLKDHQDPAGAWWLGAGRNPAITSLAVMAFLSAGQVPGEGPYGAAVEKGVRYVLTCQQANGLFAISHRHWEMYQHGICTLMLAEVAGMTENKELAKEIRRRLVKAVELILEAQHKGRDEHHGGWRYQVHSRDSDISCTGWQLLALRAAKNLGCDVPQERIAWAVAYLKRCRDGHSGGFRYMVGGNVTVPCTGTCILGLEVCGKNWHRTDESKQAGTFLLNHPPQWGSRFIFYGIYYCSQAMFQLGGNYWNAYKPKLHELLLARQNANGSWLGEGYGPIYSTSMCVLALTVEYRYLPIYQRDESGDKGK
jgi:hypothetical protein